MAAGKSQVVFNKFKPLVFIHFLIQQPKKQDRVQDRVTWHKCPYMSGKQVIVKNGNQCRISPV